MKLKELSITVSRTFNLGNFESLRVEAGATASVEEGDDPQVARDSMLAEVLAGLRQAYVRHKNKD